MKQAKKYRLLVILAGVLLSSAVCAQRRDSIINYQLPDSVKVISVFQLFRISPESSHAGRAGIRTAGLSLYFSYRGNKQEARIKTVSGGYFNRTARGQQTRLATAENLYWHTKDTIPDSIGLFITCARDSASRKQLFSSYLFYPQQKQWKLIGTWEKEGVGDYYKELQTVLSGPSSPSLTGAWFQHHTGNWKELTTTGRAVPAQNPMSNMDSLVQATRETKEIRRLNKAATLQEKEGLFYEILQPGTGALLKVTDTVTVFYKGYLLKDGTVFDQTDKEPRTFPLNRLIKGWQIGVPLLKTGGKIKLIIPSGIGYGIRTRSAKIPPNSILVFEIEVVNNDL